MPAEAPLSAGSLEAVFAPLGESRTLPPDAYRSEEVFAWEQRHFLEGSWVCVGRSSELARPGDQAAVRVGDQGILLVRDEAGTLRAFYNVCRHRGHELLEAGEQAGGRVIRCPYHAWVYSLDGTLRGAPGFSGLEPRDHALAPARSTEWHGWAFVNVSGDAVGFEDYVGDLEDLVAAHEVERLKLGASHDYEVAANWKVVHENYHECYHCSNIHPELCEVTPPDSGTDTEPTGAWAGGAMDLRSHAQTMSLSGRSDASPLRGLAPEELRHIYYYGLFPNLLISLHPDYVMTHRLEPIGPRRTRIECQWLFSPEDVSRPDFDPGYAVEFWDITNRQDWRAVESVQRGIGSRGFRPGPLSWREGSVRQFDTMVARGYLEGRVTRPTPEPGRRARAH
jgi:glycine betaine catabolism A